MDIKSSNQINIVIKLLKLLKVKVNNSSVKEALLNHPDFPSLLSISDVLQKWNIPNGAGKTTIDNLENIPTPFIARTESSVNPFILIKNIEKDVLTVEFLSSEKEEKLEKRIFEKIWEGIFLISEPNENSGEFDFKKIRKRNFLKSLFNIFIVVILIFFIFYFFNSKIAEVPKLYKIVFGLNIFLALYLIGFFVSMALLWYEIDQNNSMLHKVCTGIKKGNCSAILSGKYAKVTSWLSWSEVGFYYFTGGLLLLLFSKQIESTLIYLSWLSLLSLSYTVFSIYYQWKVAKQWCILCLTVQFTFFAGVVTSYFSGFYFFKPTIDYNFILQLFFVYTFPLLFWFSTKKYFEEYFQQKQTKHAYLRLKFNPEIFDTLLKSQMKVEHSTNGLGIELGNPNAENILIKVCNPYCGPCSKAHPKVDKLLDANPNLKVQIIFSASDVEKLDLVQPIQLFLATDEKGDKLKTRQLLDDWYNGDKNFKEFYRKYKVSDEDMTRQNKKILDMKEWCDKTKIQYTPTFFYNGYEIPPEYDVEDLQYFLME